MESILMWSILVLLIWIIIVTFLLLKTRNHYNHLVKNVQKRHLDEILETLIHQDKTLQKDVSESQKLIEHLQQEQRRSYQKIGFLRFNPFERISGDQSFILSLLDGDNNGIILNFLYTHDGIRVYSKKIHEGISTDKEFELSSEEKEVIAKAH